MPINHLEEYHKRAVKYCTDLQSNINRPMNPAVVLNPHQKKERRDIINAQTEIVNEVLKGLVNIKDMIEHMR